MNSQLNPREPAGCANSGVAWIVAAAGFVAGCAAGAQQSEVAAPAAASAEGEQVFQMACVPCHGGDGRGGQGGGLPLDKVADPALVVALVTDGRGSMPPLGEALTLQQIRAVAAYVVNDLFK